MPDTSFGRTTHDASVGRTATDASFGRTATDASVGRTATDASFGRIAIIGVGLIGGSFALGLKAAGACRHVVGVGRNPANLAKAIELGVIDSIAPSADAAVEGADVVLVATPVAQFPVLFAAIAPRIGLDAVVMDGGSTKRDVVAAARAHLGARLARFVPAHPIAGAEKSGADAAKKDLYRDRRVILTPLPETAPDAVARVTAAWEICGARVSSMAADEHDHVVAAVSHLPHVLAYALVDEMASRPDAERLFSHAAGGFRDFTRIASSHPEMWRDICVANRDALLGEIDHFGARLARLRELIDRGEGDALERLFEDARVARDAWLAGRPLPARVR